MRIYEINTRVHCKQFDQITAAELADLSNLGFDAIWLMGVWRPSEGSKKISRIISDDFHGSPFAIPRYKVNSALGGKSGFKSLVDRAHNAGLSVIVDFVSNHMAVDSPWITKRPEYFIRSDSKVRPQQTSEFFLHESGEVVAFGRDPYFPAWSDTAQLNYANKALRNQMTDVLKQISRIADGVRCDMAMLLLKDQIQRQWFPFLPEACFDDKMPGEFWDQAIDKVRRKQKNFLFIAEAYWDKERTLLDMGFDLAYEKKLYDGLVRRDKALILNRLSRSADDLSRSLCFIENHDEKRAAQIFSREENIAAMALLLSLPGSVLLHEGQMEGKREQLPVQRLKPLTEEIPDEVLRDEYIKILRLTNDDVFKTGTFKLFDPGVTGALGFLRQNESRTVVYVGRVGDSSDFSSGPIDMNSISTEVQAHDSLRVVNLLNSQSVTLQPNDRMFKCHLSELGVDRETRFCLLEATPG